MSDLEVYKGDANDLVLPGSGELVRLTHPDECVRALSSIRDLERRLREAKQELTFVLEQEFRRTGTKTLTFGATKAELRGGKETVWDIEILQQLPELGLPQERYQDLVTEEISYKVNASVAKQLAAANEQYAEVIEAAQTVIEKQRYVKIS